MNWKHIANFAKVIVAVEMAFMFLFLGGRSAWDIIQICLCQYALFSPVDVSLIIKSIRGEDPTKGA